MSRPFPKFNAGRDLLASDMDGTMFHEDLGVLAFIKKLQSPKFWTFNVRHFERLLLPNAHRRIMENGLEGNIHGLDKAACEQTLTLTKEIVRIYGEMKRLAEAGETFSPDKPILSEFVLRMLAFDDIFMKYDKVIMPHVNGMFLSRTRFFSGKNVREVKQLTGELVSTSNGQTLDITSNEKTWEEYQLSELPKDRQSLAVKLQATVQEDIFSIISRLTTEENRILQKAVVTANLEVTAKAAVENSRYKNLFKRKNVWGSLLGQKDDGTLLPKMDAPPVYAQKKVERITAERPESRLMVALGDTQGDIPMIAKSLENGGLGFFVTSDDPEKDKDYVERALVETTRKKLSEAFGNEWEQRLIYVEQTL